MGLRGTTSSSLCWLSDIGTIGESRGMHRRGCTGLASSGQVHCECDDKKKANHARAQGTNRHNLCLLLCTAFTTFLSMQHLAQKMGTKHPTKVSMDLGSTNATQTSSESSMEARPEGPWNIPSDIGCVPGPDLAAKTSEHFSRGRT